MPSYLRSNSQSPPLKRSCVSVAAIGSSQSGIIGLPGTDISSRPYSLEMSREIGVERLHRRVALAGIGIDGMKKNPLEVLIDVLVSVHALAHLRLPRPFVSCQHCVEHRTQGEHVGTSVRRLVRDFRRAI